MLTFFKDIYYSFPFQLFLLSLKRHQFLLFFWIFLLAIIVGKFGASLGMPGLFVNPEYLGKVGYLSFAIVGLGFGTMFVTWNVVLYILNSHRFPFMASLQYPLGMFFMNNALIPVLFIGAYFSGIINHQIVYEYQGIGDVLLGIAGFTAGFALILLVTGIYFNIANKNMGSYLSAHKDARRRKAIRRVQFDESMQPQQFNRVDYYVTNKLNFRHTRTVANYDPRLHRLVFRRHHFNAFIAFIVAFALLVSIGFFIENPFFQIPIAASSFLFASVLMSLFGMFLYWTGGWGSTAIILFIIVANQLTKYDLLGSQSRAYGLNYETEKAAYNMDALRTIASDSNIINDKKYFLAILENWKKKNTDPKQPGKKPVMYFINISGGGLRSTMFSTCVLQNCDSLAGGTLFDKTFMISGASGGMFGATCLREIFLKQKTGIDTSWHGRQVAYAVTGDLLNSAALSILSNDALFPYHKFEVGGYKYFKDRGYIFEKTYCRNTGFRFDKTLEDYRLDEYNATIPLMIFHTTIMNDSRRFYISPQPVSFLMRPQGKNALDNKLEIDAVDFCRFFEKQDGKKLLVTSAMRMNATFPFILPNPALPSEPPTYVMDGGALDNYGVETTLRFLKSFEEWINANTQGVVVIQIRDTEKFDEPEEQKQKTVIARLADPLGTVYNNMENMQDFLTDYRLDDLDGELQGKLKFVLFEYTTEKKEEKAGMSLHITSREREDVIHSMVRTDNANSFNRLKSLLAN